MTNGTQDEMETHRNMMDTGIETKTGSHFTNGNLLSPYKKRVPPLSFLEHN
jgi:hypothetical protein